LHIPGPALSENRANTFAIWHVVKGCPRNCPLIIYSTSDFIVGALTHFAGRNAKIGWRCANGDLLRSITMRIR
ncbi:hypothetical protein BT96DRAFT_760139, partial [Gymnopus androsaceus JB14]